MNPHTVHIGPCPENFQSHYQICDKSSRWNTSLRKLTFFQYQLYISKAVYKG